VAPIVRRPVGEPKCNFSTLGLINSDASFLAKLARRFPVSFAKSIVEASNTAESGSMRNIRDGQRSVIEEPLGKIDSASLCHGRRGSTDMPRKQPTQMTHPDTQTGGEIAQ